MNNEEIYKMIDASDTPLMDAINRIKRPVPKGWNIKLDEKPIPSRSYDYDFWHDDCDDLNRLAGTGSSIDDCFDQIEDFELTHPYFNEDN